MDENIRNEVNRHYSDIASRIKLGSKADCGSGSCCRNEDYSRVLYQTEALENIPSRAKQASLGCANPLMIANLQAGEVALDLGSGGGIDVFLAAREVGESGKVYGLDMSDEMLELARLNQLEAGVTNVEFLKGYLEDIPLPDHSVDVIMSNCVINLSADKEQVMREMARVLRPGGRIAIADIIKIAPIDPVREKELALWVSCVAGTLPINEYTKMLKKAGFHDITIEPMFIYSREHLQEMVAMGTEVDFGDLDGCYAGGLVKAVGPDYQIRPYRTEDLSAITKIYNQGVADRVASLETCSRSLNEMKDWVDNHQSPYQVLVLEDGKGEVLGWGSLNEFGTRCCAQGVADLSLYVERSVRSKGFGGQIAVAMEREAKRQGLHKLAASCLGHNPAPITLALHHGYRLVGSYANQGYLDGRWVDVVLLEKFIGDTQKPTAPSRSQCCCG